MLPPIEQEHAIAMREEPPDYWTERRGVGCVAEITFENEDTERFNVARLRDLG